MTIEEKRRELFEAFASAKWPYSGQNRRDALPQGDPRYMEYVHLEMEWQAFNAALDAVDIQMPNRFEYSNPDAAGAAILDCATAIKSTGLGLKVLP